MLIQQAVAAVLPALWQAVAGILSRTKWKLENILTKDKASYVRKLFSPSTAAFIIACSLGVRLNSSKIILSSFSYKMVD